MTPPRMIPSVSEDEVVRRTGRNLSREQLETLHGLYRARSGIVIDLAWERESKDLVLEWLPKWSLTHETPHSRRGESFNLRIHTAGRWCLLEQPRKGPKDCEQCRELTDMLEPAGVYPEAVCPADWTRPECHDWWDSLQPPEAHSRTVMNVEVGLAAQEGYEYWTHGKRQAAARKESALVSDFCSYLKRERRSATSKRITLESGIITCDVYDETRKILFEAKADATSRPQIRMAIGQLLDYGYFGFESRGTHVRRALVLPEKPSNDILELMAHLHLGVAWRLSETTFEESIP